MLDGCQRNCSSMSWTQQACTSDIVQPIIADILQSSTVLLLVKTIITIADAHTKVITCLKNLLIHHGHAGLIQIKVLNAEPCFRLSLLPNMSSGPCDSSCCCSPCVIHLLPGSKRRLLRKIGCNDLHQISCTGSLFWLLTQAPDHQVKDRQWTVPRYPTNSTQLP